MLGAINMMRIMGIFARLVARDNKPRYDAFQPRLRGLLNDTLSHPAMSRSQGLRHGRGAAPVWSSGMTKITTAMLLAAGLGTRMKPLTDTRPKPLIEVAGRTLVDRVLDKLVAQGVTRAIVNVHYLADQMEAHLQAAEGPRDHHLGRARLLLETGGGVVKALPLLGDDPFFVVNTDVTWATKGDRRSAKMAAAYDPAKMDALLLLADMEATLGFRGAGDFFSDADGRVQPARRQADRALRLRRHAHHTRRSAARLRSKAVLGQHLLERLRQGGAALRHGDVAVLDACRRSCRARRGRGAAQDDGAGKLSEQLKAADIFTAVWDGRAAHLHAAALVAFSRRSRRAA